MFNNISEKIMHQVRWLTTIGWLFLIASLFYDPISPWFTHPDNNWSILRINPEICIQVQGKCLKEQPYPLGAPIFWGIVVPSAIFILLIFGHELWRRICPLSFLSQLARGLKKERQKKRVDSKTGKVRYELVRIKKDSWLGRNYLYLQFGLLYLGLCSRILFINSDRLALGIWLIITIISAITVGYLYGGKSWCQYFCPMAPVQKIYAEPGGLFTTKAHMSEQQITQSMCRVVKENNKEQSACVACQTPCIDIDSERSYWEGMTQKDHHFVHYGYYGLVIGYFVYYYLYAGNWSYYFSGAWAHQENQLQTLLNPGFYLFNTPINIPKIIAVPLTLALFSLGGYELGKRLEKFLKSWLKKSTNKLSKEQIQHYIFTIGTYIIFNFFFIFGGRPFIILLPIYIQYTYEGLLIFLSTLWLYKTWQRSSDIYSRESLASRLYKQLSKLQLDISKYIEGRSLNDLNIDEVYVLAKVLPGFTKQKRHEAYKGVLRDALEEGYVDTSSSLEVLQQLRVKLDISEGEHRDILDELNVEDPELLNPNRLRSRENLVRLNGYRKALERVIALQKQQSNSETISVVNLLGNNVNMLGALRREYSITIQEEDHILANLDRKTAIIRRGDLLLNELRELVPLFRALNQPIFSNQAKLLTLLRSTIHEKKYVLIVNLLQILAELKDSPEGIHLATDLGNLSPVVLLEILEDSHSEWYDKLKPQIISLLKEPQTTILTCSLALEITEICQHLEALIQQNNPLIQAICLYLIALLDLDKSKALAREKLAPNEKLLLQETAQTIISLDTITSNSLSAFPSLEKSVYMFNSDFFADIYSETLIELCDRAYIKVYQTDEIVTEEGDTCRELLLLVEGEAEIILHPTPQTVIQKNLVSGQILDELEVLSHGQKSGKIIAKITPTRILAIPVDSLDEMLARDHDFARRVLELESRRLQQLLYQQ